MTSLVPSSLDLCDPKISIARRYLATLSCNIRTVHVDRFSPLSVGRVGYIM